MKHIINRLDSNGDTQVTYDVTAPAEVDLARTFFQEAIASGHLAFAVTPEAKVQVHDFDPQVGQTVLIPPMVGG